MEMEESIPRLLNWISSHFRKRAQKERKNIASVFQNRSMKRVSSKFRPPLRIIEGKKKNKLAWVSLQGLLVGAEESTSSKAIKGNLRLEEAAAWELFTPLQRVVIVAVVAVAVAAIHLNKRSQIARLRRQLEIKDQKLLSLRQKIESLKNKEDDPTEEELDYMNKDQEKPMEHQLQHMKGNKKSMRQELDFMKNKVVSLQKEFDTFKDKALSLNRDSWSSSESGWAQLAEEELHVREKEAAAQRTAADAARYVVEQVADAEFYKMKKEAEGINLVTEALTKIRGDDKTPPMRPKDYITMIKHGLLQHETPNTSPPNKQTKIFSIDADVEKNYTPKKPSETSNVSPIEQTTTSTDVVGEKKNDIVKKTSNASLPNEQTSTTSTDAAGGKIMNDLPRNDETTMQPQKGLGKTPEDATAQSKSKTENI